MVEAMSENTKGRVVDGSDMSNEFQLPGKHPFLRQCSVLIPLLFLLVMELISRKNIYSEEECVRRRSWSLLRTGIIGRRTG